MDVATTLRETSHITSANFLTWKVISAWSEVSRSLHQNVRNFFRFATNSTIQTKINYGRSYNPS